MRFITEFALENHVRPDRIYNHKERAKYDMGHLIQDSFEFKQKLFDSYTGNLATRWSLEIEAFPMDKWVEFKNELLTEFEGSYIDVDRMKTRIEKLESFGKPSGDATTNLSDLEYRGPSSHCKACEDEKNGVKHIMAQKHTCKK